MVHVQLGEAFTFVPHAFTGEQAPRPDRDAKADRGQIMPRRVTGRIAYINRAHRFFMVTVEVCGHTLRECFKF